MVSQKFQQRWRMLLAMALLMAAAAWRGASAAAAPAAKTLKPTCIPMFAPRGRGTTPSRMGNVTYALKILEMFPQVVGRLEQPQNKSTFFIPDNAALEAALAAFTSKYQQATALLGLNAANMTFELFVKNLDARSLEGMLDAHTVLLDKIVFKRKPKKKPAPGALYNTKANSYIHIPAYIDRRQKTISAFRVGSDEAYTARIVRGPFKCAKGKTVLYTVDAPLFRIAPPPTMIPPPTAPAPRGSALSQKLAHVDAGFSVSKAVAQVVGPDFDSLEVPEGSIICIAPNSWNYANDKGCYTDAKLLPTRQLIATVTPTATADGDCPWLKQFCTDRTLQSSSDKKAQFKSMLEALYFQGPQGDTPWPRIPEQENFFVSDPISENFIYRVTKTLFDASYWPAQNDGFHVERVNTHNNADIDEEAQPGSNYQLSHYFHITFWAVIRWKLSPGWYWTPNCPSAATAAGYSKSMSGAPAGDFMCKSDGSSDDVPSGYVGCALAEVPFFSDQNVIKSTKNMTNTYCAELASEAEYTYFGTYAPGECLGFSATPPLRWRSKSTDCSTPCVGDNTQMCGGSSSAKRVEFISVYRVPVLEEFADPLDKFFEGCYVRDVEPAWSIETDTVLNGELEPGVYDVSTMTNDKCVQLATGRGFRYAGTKSADYEGTPISWCFGRNATASFFTADEYCSFQCSGNSSQQCGAPDLVTVHRTSVGKSSDSPLPPSAVDFGGFVKACGPFGQCFGASTDPEFWMWLLTFTGHGQFVEADLRSRIGPETAITELKESISSHARHMWLDTTLPYGDLGESSFNVTTFRCYYASSRNAATRAAVRLALQATAAALAITLLLLS